MMITYSIERYKPKVEPPNSPPERMSKFAYNVWLSANVHVKRGDLLINKYVLEGNSTPIKPAAIFIVDDIQEIHYMVDYEGNTPKCLALRNTHGVRFWNVPDRWVKAPEEVLKQVGIDKATFEWKSLC